MRQYMKYFLLSWAVVAVLLTVPGRASAQSGVVAHMGTLPDGATFLIEVPANWNGTLFLYSHGYVVPGSPNPAQDFAITDPATRFFMLSSGFALAGSSYATTGWAIQQALPDQIAVLDIFSQAAESAKHNMHRGHSLGCMTSAGLIQRSMGQFAEAPPVCGFLSEGIATLYTAINSDFAFNTLLGAPG